MSPFSMVFDCTRFSEVRTTLRNEPQSGVTRSWISRKTAIVQLLLVIISGIALALAFPPDELSLLSWIAFVPLLYAIEGCELRKVLAFSWIQQFTFCMASGCWVFSTLHHYARLSATRSAVELCLLCLMLAGFGACAIVAAKFVNKRLLVPICLGLPAAWVAGEWMRTQIPFSFPWNLLGYAAYRDLKLIQFAEFTGVYGISALVIFVNASLYDFLFSGSRLETRAKLLIAPAAAVIIALIFGAVRVREIDSARPTGSLRVAMISGGLPPARVHNATMKAETLALYVGNTQLTLAQHPDLIVWPESAANGIFQPDGRYSLLMNEDASYYHSMVNLARESNTPILFGALAFRQSQWKVTMLNRAYLLSRRGEVEGYYGKIKLVPFGEYLPMKWLLARQMTTIAGIPNLEKGSSEAIFSVAGAKLGVRICYETVFPDLTRQAVNAGADFVVNITNDAWYGKFGSEQALAMTAMRAVETKRPVVRVANRGFSAIISPVGKIQIGPQFASATGIVRRIDWPAVKTVYARFGDIFAQTCAALTAIALILAALMSCVGISKP